MPHSITFFVAGEPAPKGSTRAFVVHGRPIITGANRRTKDWEMRIATEAQALSADCVSCPVAVHGWFILPRPKSLPRKVLHHVKKPDLDKLGRALLDGLTGILYVDDSQVVELSLSKHYASAGEPTGVRVMLDHLGAEA